MRPGLAFERPRTAFRSADSGSLGRWAADQRGEPDAPELPCAVSAGSGCCSVVTPPGLAGAGFGLAAAAAARPTARRRLCRATSGAALPWDDDGVPALPDLDGTRLEAERPSSAVGRGVIGTGALGYARHQISDEGTDIAHELFGALLTTR